MVRSAQLRLRQHIANDAIVGFGVERSVIERDPGSTGIAALGPRTEAGDHVSPALAGGVLQGHQKSAGGRLVVAVIAAAPGVDVHHAVRGDHHVPGVADVIGKHRCAEARREDDAAVITGTGRVRHGRVARLLRQRSCRSQQQHSDDVQGHRGATSCAATVQSSIGHDRFLPRIDASFGDVRTSTGDATAAPVFSRNHLSLMRRRLHPPGNALALIAAIVPLLRQSPTTQAPPVLEK